MILLNYFINIMLIFWQIYRSRRKLYDIFRVICCALFTFLCMIIYDLLMGILIVILFILVIKHLSYKRYFEAIFTVVAYIILSILHIVLMQYQIKILRGEISKYVQIINCIILLFIFIFLSDLY